MNRAVQTLSSRATNGSLPARRGGRDLSSCARIAVCEIEERSLVGRPKQEAGGLARDDTNGAIRILWSAAACRRCFYAEARPAGKQREQAPALHKNLGAASIEMWPHACSTPLCDSKRGNAMPLVNGKFYANALYGRALEMARAADSGKIWSGDYTDVGQPHPEEISARNSERTPAQRPAASHKEHSKGDNHNAATTPEGVANQVYNETSGLRPTDKKDTGPGSDWDMQQARTAMAHVIQNRAKARMPGGLTTPEIASKDDARDIRIIGTSAYDAHAENLSTQPTAPASNQTPLAAPHTSIWTTAKNLSLG